MRVKCQVKMLAPHRHREGASWIDKGARCLVPAIKTQVERVGWKTRPAHPVGRHPAPGMPAAPGTRHPAGTCTALHCTCTRQAGRHKGAGTHKVQVPGAGCRHKAGRQDAHTRCGTRQAPGTQFSLLRKLSQHMQAIKNPHLFKGCGCAVRCVV